MKKSTVKRLAACGLAFFVFFSGSGAVSAAGELPAYGDFALCAEAASGDGDDVVCTEAAKLAAGGDKSLKACGSDGILYSGVTYLSASTVLGFDADTREAYLELCDEIALWKQNGDAVSDIVLFTDANGDLGFSYFAANQHFSAEEVRKEQGGNVSEDEYDTGVTILGTTDAEDVSVHMPGDTDGGAAAGENLSLAESAAVAEVEFDEQAKTFDTLYTNENYFRDQLTALEQTIYDAAKAKMVKGSSNSCSVRLSEAPTNTNIHNVLSAIQDTYPSSFDWVERGDGGANISCVRRGDVWNVKIIVKKSKFYSSSLLSGAKKKAKKLTDEAYAYAEENYPDNPTYGIVKYFDEWICSNNYFNNIGVGSTEEEWKSKEYFYCHSSFGVLLKGYGVSESYALAMNRLLDEAGIPSMVVYGRGPAVVNAWNYVQMPDGNWYLLDSTMNDGGTSSNGEHLLSAADADYVATGASFTVGRWFAIGKFTYPTPAGSEYTAGAAETISLNQTELILKKGQKGQLALAADNYHSRFKCTWTSDNTKVAKVDAKGKITAVAPGRAVISCRTAGGMKASCKVYVYQFTGLQFKLNEKAAYTCHFENTDTAFDSKDLQTFYIHIEQKNYSRSASDIQTQQGLAAPKATTSNAKVATVSSCELDYNTIVLKVQPEKPGNAKINVSFGGKKATLTLKVTQHLQPVWFNPLPITGHETYNGKAFTPKVTASASMPKGVTYKLTYENNKNAGNARVYAKGTGNYSGTIWMTFRIDTRDFTKAQFVSCTSQKTYNGKANPAVTVVKWGGKKLKAGVDYDVYYNDSNVVPVNAGTYTVKVTGKGNYSGALEKTFTYTIKTAPVTSLKVSCPSTGKYNNGAAVTPNIKVKIGSTVISEDNYTLQWQNAEGKVVTAPAEKGKYTLTVAPRGNVAATAKKKVITKTFRVR